MTSFLLPVFGGAGDFLVITDASNRVSVKDFVDARDAIALGLHVFVGFIGPCDIQVSCLITDLSLSIIQYCNRMW